MPNFWIYFLSNKNAWWKYSKKNLNTHLTIELIKPSEHIPNFVPHKSVDQAHQKNVKGGNEKCEPTAAINQHRDILVQRIILIEVDEQNAPSHQ